MKQVMVVPSFHCDVVWRRPPEEQPSVPLDLGVTGEVELTGGVIRQRVEYNVAPGERVPAYHRFRTYEEPERGHEITEGMLAGALAFPRESLAEERGLL